MSIGQGAVIDSYVSAVRTLLNLEFPAVLQYGEMDGRWPLIDDRWYLATPDILYFQIFALYTGDNSASTADANESNVFLARCTTQLRFSLRMASRADQDDKIWSGLLGQPVGLINNVLNRVSTAFFWRVPPDVVNVESIEVGDTVRSGQVFSLIVVSNVWLATTATPDPE